MIRIKNKKNKNEIKRTQIHEALSKERSIRVFYKILFTYLKASYSEIASDLFPRVFAFSTLIPFLEESNPHPDIIDILASKLRHV